jgi:hypothetical protein
VVSSLEIDEHCVRRLAKMNGQLLKKASSRITGDRECVRRSALNMQTLSSDWTPPKSSQINCMVASDTRCP